MERDAQFLPPGLAANAYSRDGLKGLALIYLGAMAGSALISPWVYFGIQAWHEQAPSTLSHYLADKAYDDYFDRLRWLPVLIALPWIIRLCGLTREAGSEFHFGWSRGLQFLGWLCTGGSFLTIIIFTQMLFLDVSHAARYLFSGVDQVLRQAAISAVAVALLEQFVFRTLLFRLFYAAFPPWTAIWAAAVFFAYTHFKMPDAVWDATGGAVHWYSGWQVAGWTLVAAFSGFHLFHFVNLVCLGVLHNYLYLHTRSFWPGVGLHAGLVFLLIAYQKLFNTFLATSPSFLGTDRVVDGVLPALLALGCLFYLLHSGKRADPPPA